MQTQNQHNSVSIEIVFKDSPEEFILQHANNLEKFHRIGLTNRIVSILKSWVNKKIDMPRPILITNFKLQESSAELTKILNEINSKFISGEKV
jgi:hypothetical protein